MNKYDRKGLFELLKKFWALVLFLSFIFYFLLRITNRLAPIDIIVFTTLFIYTICLCFHKNGYKNHLNIILSIWSIFFVIEILVTLPSYSSITGDFKVFLWFGVFLIFGTLFLIAFSYKVFREKSLYGLFIITPLIFAPLIYFLKQYGIPLNILLLMIILVVFIGISLIGVIYIPTVIILGLAERYEYISGKRMAGLILGTMISVYQFAKMLISMQPVFLSSLHISTTQGKSSDILFIIIFMVIFGLISFFIFLRFPQSYLSKTPD